MLRATAASGSVCGRRASTSLMFAAVDSALRLAVHGSKGLPRPVDIHSPFEFLMSTVLPRS